MPRNSQLLYPPYTPAQPRPAATVLLVREQAGDGLQVLMTRRSLHASFAPGAYVFPGGVVDAQDASAAARAQATRRADQDGAALTDALAAIRESFEELGVLLACQANGQPVPAAEVATLDRHAPLLPQCQARGWLLDAARIWPLARWVTDRDLPKRFDVPFLLAHMPPGQSPQADEREQFDPVWISPARALVQHKAGQFDMIFPTIRTLERLQHHASASALIASLQDGQPWWHSCPRAGWLGGQEARYMEHEAPFGELELVTPDGQLQHRLDWQHHAPVPLLKNLLRLTAANAGVMTGPGTNSYVVGDAACGYVVIDPGPHDPAHIQRLWQATGGDVRAIICTHSHPDHAPGAVPLQALCAQAPHGRPPVLGLPSGPHARADSRFVPDRALADGELITLQDASGQVRHSLQVIHTPGHMSNHICLLLQEDGLLFSGDHILNGSTTVIDPPDGCMSAYLHALDRLHAACTQWQVSHILPAHGYALGQPLQAITRLKTHRLAREAKVSAAMRLKPAGTLEDWLPLAYDDVPPALWPVARRSLLAHVQRLQALAADPFATDDTTTPA